MESRAARQARCDHGHDKKPEESSADRPVSLDPAASKPVSSGSLAVGPAVARIKRCCHPTLPMG